MQRFVHAELEGSERAAALQNQYDLARQLWPAARWRFATVPRSRFAGFRHDQAPLT